MWAGGSASISMPSSPGSSRMWVPPVHDEYSAGVAVHLHEVLVLVTRPEPGPSGSSGCQCTRVLGAAARGTPRGARPGGTGRGPAGRSCPWCWSSLRPPGPGAVADSTDTCSPTSRVGPSPRSHPHPRSRPFLLYSEVNRRAQYWAQGAGGLPGRADREPHGPGPLLAGGGARHGHRVPRGGRAPRRRGARSREGREPRSPAPVSASAPRTATLPRR